VKRNFRVVRSCAREALQDFNWLEYAPFGCILAAQLVFLFLAMNMGSVWGMATAGGVARLVGGERQLQYPQFFVYLPGLMSIVEAFLYTLPGSLLIPLSLIRVLAPMDHSLAEGYGVGPRLRQALLPTLFAGLSSAALLYAWQYLLHVGPEPMIRAMVPGSQAMFAIWGLSVLGAYALSACFLYVPIAAIRPGATLREALGKGLREGVELFAPTLFFIFIFSWPALPFLLVAGLKALTICEKLRPEVVAVIMGIYTVLISVASYLTYAAAARLHWSAQREEG
jgi:hypothetical protein